MGYIGRVPIVTRLCVKNFTIIIMANAIVKHTDRKMVQKPFWNYSSTEHPHLASSSAT